MALEAGSAQFLPEEVAKALHGGAGPQRDPAALDAAAEVLAKTLVAEDLSLLLTAAFDDVPVAYGFHWLDREGAESFTQASTFEPFTSPAELAAVYVPVGEAGGGRLDFVRDSHECPEFTSTGQSRWTGQQTAILPVIVAGLEQPIDSIDLAPGQVVAMSPGLIHRASPASHGGILRITFAPKRNTPLRFLTGEGAWQELSLGRGLRARVG